MGTRARRERGPGEGSRRPARQAGFDDLLEAGRWAAARARARAVLADGRSTDPERREAAAALERLRPERGAVIAGAAGVVAAVLLAAWTLLR
jgi:hypothetical protein